MSSIDILAAIKAKYPRAAVVPELTIDVPEWHDTRNNGGDNTAMKPFRRIDALMVESLQRTAIEIKISAADWKRESVAKYGPWSRVCHRFVYAVPAGLEPPESLISTGAYNAGLWWVHEDGRIEVRRKARLNNHPEPLPNMVIQRLAYRAAGMDVTLGRPQTH